KNNSLPAKITPLLVIDQHQSLEKPKAGLAIIAPKIGATSVILANALLSLNKPIPAKVATALVYGIATDTNNLFRVAGRETIEVYTSLLPFCDMKALAKIQSPQHPASFFKTMGKVIQDAIVSGRLISIHLGVVDNHDLIPQFAEFLYTYRGATVSFCTGRYHGFLRMSLRTSKSSEPAGEILRQIVNDPSEAGGHGTVGGGMIKVGAKADETIWQELEQTLTGRLKLRLRIGPDKETKFPFRD
ncbi:MAG: DHH family phosphoesterase, partial [Candidatus Zixiibacteriota bacterium]